MATVATATLEGSSNVSGSWASDLEKARGQVDQFGQQANKSLGGAGAAGKNAAQQMNSLYQGAQALAGSAIVVKAAQLASELWEIGGSAQEAYQNMNALTSGQADAYMNAVSESSDGMISRLDAAQISSQALNYGLRLSANQMGGLAKAATVLADITGTDTTSAYNTLTDAIGRGNSRMLQQLGIVSKGVDMQAEINKVIAQNGDLTYTQASQLAAYNMVMERANELQEKGVGQTRSASDVTEQLSAKMEDAKADAGNWLANGLMPIINGMEEINKAYDEEEDRLARNAKSFNEYAESHAKMEWSVFKPAMMNEEQFAAQKTEQATAPTGTGHGLQPEELAQIAASQQGLSTTVDQLNGSYASVASTMQQYAESLADQAGLEIEAVGTAALLTSGQANMSDVFSAGMGLLDGAGLSAMQTRDAYEALGLATGELTTKQIGQGDGLRELTNLATSGIISWSDYGEALVNVSQGSDALALADEKIKQAGGGDSGKERADNMKAAGEAAGGMKKSLEDVEAELGKYQDLLAQASGQVKTEFENNLDAGVAATVDKYSGVLTYIRQIPTINTIFATNAAASETYGAVDELYNRASQLKNMGTISLVVNIKTNGTLPALPTGYQPEGGQ